MDWLQVKGNWNLLKGKIREQWGKLTDDEIEQAAGQRDQLVGRLQERYGYARDKAERELDDFVARL
jgi:uncharacterized protein YjbJ (UPF0337 family)